MNNHCLIFALCLLLASIGRSLADSCKDRCKKDDDGGVFDCLCNVDCIKKENCCPDYIDQCHGGNFPSCKNLCSQKEELADRPCQCGPMCLEKNNCCPDYIPICVAPRVSDEEISNVAESLLFWDDYSDLKYLHINFQNLLSSNDCAGPDAISPLLTFKEIPTYETYNNLIKLYGDYDSEISKNESLSNKWETQALIISIISSNVMKGVANFLIEKGFVNSQTHFQQIFKIMWFNFYKRSKDAEFFSSTGFEHVFLGELTKKKVEGFHNWIYLVHETKNISYKGYNRHWELHKDKISVIDVSFKWRELCKSRSTMFVGSSPEFEFALYTLCWFTRPNSLCPININGVSLSVQTYQYVDYLGKRHVAAAFPVLSDSCGIPLTSGLVLTMTVIFSTIYFRF